MSIRIRRARPDEAATLTDIVFRAKQSNGYDDAFMEACREELAISQTTLTEHAYWVAEDGDLLGCAALQAKLPTGEVHAFFVDAGAQRRGVGRQLWDVIKREAILAGCAGLALDADPAAVPFYERLGFRVVGDAPSGSIPGRMIPRMAIDLSPVSAQDHNLHT